MTNTHGLLHAFAGRCAGWSYDHVQVDDREITASRSTSQGFQTLELGLIWKRRSWRVHLTATTAFFLSDEDPGEGIGRSTMPRPPVTEAKADPIAGDRGCQRRSGGWTVVGDPLWAAQGGQSPLPEPMSSRYSSGWREPWNPTIWMGKAGHGSMPKVESCTQELHLA